MKAGGASAVILIGVGDVDVAAEDRSIFGVVSGNEVWEGREVAQSADDFVEVTKCGGLGLAGVVGVDIFGDVVAVPADVGEVADDALALGLVGDN